MKPTFKLIDVLFTLGFICLVVITMIPTYQSHSNSEFVERAAKGSMEILVPPTRCVECGQICKGSHYEFNSEAWCLTCYPNR